MEFLAIWNIWALVGFRVVYEEVTLRICASYDALYVKSIVEVVPHLF